ncbi:gag protein [Artemisia annua]|uniref:Gag protein n=1 Tax=Artemisia annua TaxID=35608 RepID=A0A2U1Q4E8_ARTAN|nr:gag protein [Artemisia annua]
MSGDDPLQTPAQGATGDLGEPNAKPTPITHETGGPSDTILEPDLEDPIMQFVVHNFDRMNAMYKAFTRKLKDVPTPPAFTNADPPIIEPWNSDSDDVQQGKAKENPFVESDNGDPSKSRDAVRATPLTNTDRDARDLVASSFTKRIRDYDMPDDIKVTTNLRAYDGTTDPDDHLTVFMGTMDVHKLPEPAWCRFFHITLSGAARFWYDNLTPGSINGFHQLRDKFRANFLQQRRFQKTQAEILGIRQRPDESLKDYVARFSKETLHMADRFDVMVSGAFISGLRPGRLFKDLIAKPLTSLEDLFTQTHNFIRAEDANNENRLREPRRETKQHTIYKDLPRRQKDKHVSRNTGHL